MSGGRVARYVVGVGLPFEIGAGSFTAGDFVYDSWLDGWGDSFVRRGILTPAGFVDADDPVLVVEGPAPADDVDATGGSPSDPGTGPAPSTSDAPTSTAGGTDDPIAVLLDGAVPEILATLDGDDHGFDVAAVIAAEEAGKGRKGIIAPLIHRLASEAGGNDPA